MNRLNVIGVTGPTGSGKTTVCSIIRACGIHIINADHVAHDILKNNKDCINQLTKSFSQNILLEDGSINRSRLADVAFSSRKNTNLLNQITHPLIVGSIKSMLKNYSERKIKVVVIDAALLFESNLDKLCNTVWTVLAPEEVRIARIISRDKITLKQAMQRINSQHEDIFFKKNSNVVIDGTLPLKKLRSSILKILEQYDENTY